MHRFQGKYRIPSARLKKWDYAAAGYYYVTLCTAGHQPFFGEIIDGVMNLSDIGNIVAEEWQRTEQIRPYVTLDEWVIMPNHMHAILIINGVETPRRGVSTTDNRSWKPGTLGAIINQFKSKCTKRIRAAGHPTFAWQARFHDHIIRNEQSLDRIRAYIRGNPILWEQDEYHPGIRKPNWKG